MSTTGKPLPPTPPPPRKKKTTSTPTQPKSPPLPSSSSSSVLPGGIPAYRKKCEGQTIRNPDTGVIQPVVCQDGWEEWSGWERAAGVIAYGMIIVQLIVFVVIVGFLFQNLRTNFTYFPFGVALGAPPPTCTLTEFYYGGRVALFFFVLLNLTDIPLSLAAGTKFWGAASLPMAVVTSFLDVLYVAVIGFYYGVSCNSSNNGAAYNICDNRLLCGIASYMANPANLCSIVNPMNLTVYPSVTIAQVPWDPTFEAFFILLGSYTACGIVKSIAIWLIPGSTIALREGVSASLKLIQQLKNMNKNNALTTVGSHLNDLKTFAKKLFNRMEFLDLLAVRHIVFYLLAMSLSGACFVYFYIWLGWYQQNSRAWVNEFQALSPGSPNAQFVNAVEGPTIYFVYILAALHVIPISLMLVRMGQVFSTEVAFISSAIGGVITLIQIFVVLLYFVVSCNQDNSGYYNLCTEPLKLCSTYSQITSNNCPNQPYYVCPASYPPSAFQGAQNWSSDFQILFIFLLLLLLTYIVNCIVGWFLIRRFKMFTQPRRKIIETLRANGDGDDSILTSPADDLALEKEFASLKNAGVFGNNNELSLDSNNNINNNNNNSSSNNEIENVVGNVTDDAGNDANIADMLSTAAAAEVGDDINEGGIKASRKRGSLLRQRKSRNNNSDEENNKDKEENNDESGEDENVSEDEEDDDDDESEDKESEEENNNKGDQDSESDEDGEEKGHRNNKVVRRYHPGRPLLDDEIYIHPVGKDPKIYKQLHNDFTFTGDHASDLFSSIFY